MAQLSWKFIEDPIRQGALKNFNLQNLRVRNLAFSGKLALACALLVSMTASFGLLTAGHVKENSKKVRVEAIQTEQKEKAEHSVIAKDGQTNESMQNKEEKETVSMPPKEPLTVTAVGDSIMIDVSSYLKNTFPNIRIDAKIGRQMSEAFATVDRMEKEGILGNHIIIGLGTNGAFTTEQIESLIQLIGNERKIVLVNTRVPRPWESLVNKKLKEAASKFSNITLVDWYSASAGQQAYFEPDGVHLTKVGAEAYASLVEKYIND